MNQFCIVVLLNKHIVRNMSYSQFQPSVMVVRHIRHVWMNDKLRRYGDECWNNRRTKKLTESPNRQLVTHFLNGIKQRSSGSKSINA